MPARPHCFLFTPGTVATPEGQQQRVKIPGCLYHRQQPGPKQPLGLNSQHACLQQTWSHSGGLFKTKWKTHIIKHILNLTRRQCSVKMVQLKNTLTHSFSLFTHSFDFHGHKIVWRNLILLLYAENPTELIVDRLEYWVVPHYIFISDTTPIVQQ